MAYIAYVRFKDPTLKVKKGNQDMVPDKDLKTGQNDNIDPKEQNPNYKASDGWMRVIQWDYEVAANAELSGGVSVGNVQLSICKLLKYTGENSLPAYRALFNRAAFDVELALAERTGTGENKEWIHTEFHGAVFTRIRSATGDPTGTSVNGGGGSASTAISGARSDTKELDWYEFVYQAKTIRLGTMTVHCSVHGTTK
jgi:hypothetical protein